MNLEIIIKDFRFEVILDGDRLIGDANPTEDGGYSIALSKCGDRTGIGASGSSLINLRDNLVEEIKRQKLHR